MRFGGQVLKSQDRACELSSLWMLMDMRVYCLHSCPRAWRPARDAASFPPIYRSSGPWGPVCTALEPVSCVLTASVVKAHDLRLAGSRGRTGLRELSDGVSWGVRKSVHVGRVCELPSSHLSYVWGFPGLGLQLWGTCPGFASGLLCLLHSVGPWSCEGRSGSRPGRRAQWEGGSFFLLVLI